MPGDMSAATAVLGQIDVTYWLVNTVAFLKVVIGFSLIILVHELGHFWVAKWCGVRVDKFAIGFGPRLFGWRRGQGFTTGTDTHITPEEVTSRGWGESDYCINALPFGGYVKMLGEDDILINEDTGEIKLSEDPRAFPQSPGRTTHADRLGRRGL
jgi:regulator of sigma E protease